MRKLFVCLAAIGFGLFAMASSAMAFSLAGDYVGPVIVQFQNWDVGTTYSASTSASGIADGKQDSFGLIKVTSITDLSANSLWSNTPTESIEGWFYGLDDDDYAFDATGSGFINSNLGKIKLYIGANDMNVIAGAPPAMPGSGLLPPADADVWSATNGTLFLEADFVPGINSLSGDSTTTYRQTITTITTPVEGQGAGYLSVIGGSQKTMFDTNAYNSIYPGADAYLQIKFNTGDLSLAESSIGWTVKSSGTAKGFATPEPASLAIFGIGLLGIGGAIRKRRVS